MNTEQYESNSHKSREAKAIQVEERKKLDKVISGTAKTKKKSEVSKFFRDFIDEDLPKVRTFVVKDVIIPSIKKAIVETIDMILYGDSRGGRGRTNASRVSYRSYYDEPRTSRDRAVETRTGYGYDDVVLETRGDAEQVLSQMDDLISEYGVASIADLYDLVGISGNYTDNKYGWTNLRNAEVKRVRDGFMLDLPKALPIK